MIYLNTRDNIRSFGRINSKRLTATDDNIIKNDLPKIQIELGDTINLSTIFHNNNKNYLEIGFGYGESIIKRAVKDTDINYIGCESYTKGVANLTKMALDLDSTNLRIFYGDARLLLQALLDKSLDRIFILFPDPWPKIRQNKRRIINSDFIKLISLKLKSGGEIIFASDILDYVKWTISYFQQNEVFVPLFHEYTECTTEPDWWIKTKYQSKALQENRSCYFLTWRKK